MTAVAGVPGGGPRGARSRFLLAGPLLATLAGVAVVWLLDSPVADLQAAIAREQAAGAGVGLTYWFGWYGGVSPGSYSFVVPLLSQLVGSTGLLFLASLAVVAAAYPLSRGTAHPVLFRWAVAAGVVSNMASGRVAFAVGAALALAGVLAVRAGRPVPGAVALAASGLASPLVPAFAGLAAVPLLLAGNRSRPVLATLAGATVGVVVPYVLFGAPGFQPFPLTTLIWCGAVALGAYPALHGRPQRWLVPLAAVTAVVLFLVPTGVGSNLGRFSYLVLPCLVLAWSAWSRWRVLLALLPAAAWMVYAGVTDQVTAIDTGYTAADYAPLRDALAALPDLDGHRVELLDNTSHAGSHELGPDIALARGWENQTDARYNEVLIEPHAVDAPGYRAWLDDNAVAYVAVAAQPLDNVRTRSELRLVRAGLPYLTEVWSDRNWTLYRVADPTPIVPAPLTLVETTPARMVVDVPDTGTHEIRVRASRYLVAHGLDDPATVACLGATGAGWVQLRVPVPGRYVLEGELTVSTVLGEAPEGCG
ncbi:hypothetical protein [Blastococcus sp. SYSU D00695]